MTVKNVEKKENSTVIFQVEIDKDAFENAIDKAYKRLKNQLSVPGFRKGKAPRVVLEGRYGAELFHDEAVQILAPEAFEQAAQEAKIDAVGVPSIADYNVDDDKNLTITFTTEVYPEVTLGQYRGLEAEWTEPAVSDEEVDAAIERERKNRARYVDVERPAQLGDTVVLDFEGFVDGVAFAGGKAEEYNLELGSGAFIPGFEDQLVGMESGQEGEVHVTFPEQYEQSLAGKDATFKVKIHAVREPQLAELDDEFAKDVSEFDTFAEYRDDVRAKLLETATEREQSNFKAQLMNKALENMTAVVPEGMVQEKTDDFLRSYAESMGLGANVSREDVLKMLGVTEDAFMQMMRPAAMRQVQADLLLDAIVKAENLEASQEDKDEFYKQIEADYGESAEKIKAMIDEELMVRDLVRRKAASVIYDSGVKTEPRPAETAEEAPAEE